MNKPITPSWVSRAAWGSTWDTIEDRFASVEFFASHKASHGTISSPAPTLTFALPAVDSRIHFEALKFDVADQLRLQISSDGITFDSVSGDYTWSGDTRTIDNDPPNYFDGSGPSMFVADIPASTDPLGLDVKLGIDRGSYLDVGRVMAVSFPPDDPSLVGTELVTHSRFFRQTRGPSVVAVKLFTLNGHNFAAGRWCVYCSGYQV